MKLPGLNTNKKPLILIWMVYYFLLPLLPSFFFFLVLFFRSTGMDGNSGYLSPKTIIWPVPRWFWWKCGYDIGEVKTGRNQNPERERECAREKGEKRREKREIPTHWDDRKNSQSSNDATSDLKPEAAKRFGCGSTTTEPPPPPPPPPTTATTEQMEVAWNLPAGAKQMVTDWSKMPVKSCRVQAQGDRGGGRGDTGMVTLDNVLMDV